MPELPPARYERSDVTARSALIAFPAILLALLLTILLALWLYPGSSVDRRVAGPLPAFPEPRLQADAKTDMQKFLAQEMARLNSAGWDDRSKGLGHIPIDDAMRRVAASGIPDWPK